MPSKGSVQEQGFSLIELLVVVAIIGILASIAVPQFQEYKTRGFDARAISDMRNIISAQEAQYVNTETYQASMSTLEGFDTESPAVSVILEANAGGWNGKTYHPLGTSTFCYDSSSQSGVSKITGLNASCPWE